MQCDFDTIGTRSTASDIETALVIHDLLRAIGIRDFTIRLNNRMLLTGLLERQGLVERSGLGASPPSISSARSGRRRLRKRWSPWPAPRPSRPARCSSWPRSPARNDEVLRQVEPLVAGNATGETGVGKLRETLAALAAVGVAEPRVKLDVSIARGLDYYTGTIFETFLNELPSIGSICSGGRYDNLAELYTHQELPGIGASLGLDRLLAALEKLGLVEKVATPAPVFIPYFDEARLHDYLRLAAALRAAGIGVEVYPEAKKLGQQLKYADRRGFRVALIAGQNEFDKGVCQVKDLQSGEKKDVPLGGEYAELIEAVRILTVPARNSNVQRVEIRNFRSCHSVVLDDLGPVTVLVGRNAVGKSNVLRAVQWAAETARAGNVGRNINGFR